MAQLEDRHGCKFGHWGHPITSGLPTIDYFISSELMEPAQGDNHYSEKLIRLSNLGIAYAKPSLPPQIKTRLEMGHFETMTFCIVGHIVNWEACSVGRFITVPYDIRHGMRHFITIMFCPGTFCSCIIT